VKKGSFYIRIAVSLLLTLLFIWIAFREKDLGELTNTMLRQPLIWFVGLFALHTFSHLLRAIRWKILIEPVKKDISLHAAFSSLMIGFMINGILPRAGELVRSYVLGKKEHIPTSALLSTVILERLLDFISFATVLLTVVILNVESIMLWFPFLSGTEWVLYIIASFLFILFITLFLTSGIVFSFVKKISALAPSASRKKIDGIMDSFIHGFQASTEQKNYGIIALLTFSIWFTYIVLLYLPFRLFGMTDLTMLSAATLQISSGIASAMPTPNGIGSYHSFIAITLEQVFHINESTALAYVVYTHAILYLCPLLIGSGYLLKENIRFSELMKANREE